MIGINGKAEISISISNNNGFVIAVNAYQEVTTEDSAKKVRQMTMRGNPTVSSITHFYTASGVDEAINIIREQLLELQS